MPLLVIQRGHVPRTSGATGTAGEQQMAIAVAAECVKQARPGWAVRVIDADVPDASYKGDRFVAIHGDGSTNRTISGASVGYRSGGSKLAAAWKAAYTAQGWSRGFHADNYTSALSGYYGVRHATEQGNDEAIVIEVGMMTNPTDRAWIDANVAAIARSIWAAVAGEEAEVLDYFIIPVICETAAVLAAAKVKCNILGIKAVSCGNALYAHCNKDKGELLQSWVKATPGAGSLKGVPTTGETAAAMGLVKDVSLPSCDTVAADLAAAQKRIAAAKAALG